MSEWWAGIAPVETTVPCDEARHRLRWANGRLIACDHGDLDDERALTALGRISCPCIDLARTWERHHDDLRALQLGPTGVGGAELFTDTDGPASVMGGRGRRRPRRPGGNGHSRPPASWFGSSAANAPDDDAEGLMELIQLGGGFAARLAATVAATWLDRVRQRDPGVADAARRLYAALFERVLAAVQGWLGEADLTLDLEMMREDGPRAVARDGDVVRASLPFGWLVDVWARGLAVVQGRFCLSAETTDGRVWVLQTIAPDLRTLERIELRIGD